MADLMTRRDRQDLAQLTRQRERVAKSSTAQRSAEMKADAERQLAATFKAEDERWATITAAAKEMITEANGKILEICRSEGIAEEFAPTLHIYWSSRGENAMGERRAELRRVAYSQIEAIEKAAKAEIERKSVEVQTEIMTGGLETDAARLFLESMPTAEQLMPMLSIAEIEAAVPFGQKVRRYLDA